jgi:hypothetical protein
MSGSVIQTAASALRLPCLQTTSHLAVVQVTAVQVVVNNGPSYDTTTTTAEARLYICCYNDHLSAQHSSGITCLRVNGTPWLQPQQLQPQWLDVHMVPLVQQPAVLLHCSRGSDAVEIHA